MDASESRWKQAQSYEKSFWQSLAGSIQAGKFDLNWYNYNAQQLQKFLKEAFKDNLPAFEKGRALEVGSGPIGILSYFEAAERVAVDPLNDYFSSQEELVKHRNPAVEYRTARGEKLEFADSSFDLVIIENVIDHVKNADQVMQEINRVLKPDATLYLAVNLHPAWGYFLHEILSKLSIDRGHPHTFTVNKVRQFLDGHGFELLHENWDDYKTKRGEDRKSSATTDKIKGYTGLSEYLYYSVSKKR